MTTLIAALTPQVKTACARVHCTFTGEKHVTHQKLVEGKMKEVTEPIAGDHSIPNDDFVQELAGQLASVTTAPDAEALKARISEVVQAVPHMLVRHNATMPIRDLNELYVTLRAMGETAWRLMRA